MKKALIITILLLFVLILPAFCDPAPNITFGFRVLKDKTNGNNNPELKLHFYKIDWETEAGANKNAGSFANRHSDINDMNIDNTKNLSQPQVIVAFETRYIYNFYFWLRFSPMTSDGSDYKGKYDATVYDRIFYDTFSERNSEMLILTESHTAHEIEFPEEGPVVPVNLRLKFPAMTEPSVSGNGRERWMYPIAFDFSEYLSSYPAGEYTAAITVEVNSL